jgi:hypothetical protein
MQDGRYFGFISQIEITPGRSPVAVVFDEAEFLSGAAAQKAAEEDGAVPPGEPVSNDYYIRYGDRKPTRLEVAKDVRVTVVRCPSSCREGNPGRFPALLTGADHPPYWVTTADGVVTRIDQQYVP